jgi:hypothetical protein
VLLRVAAEALAGHDDALEMDESEQSLESSGWLLNSQALRKFPDVLIGADALEQYQQLGRVRRPQCRSAAIAGDGRLDALADPRLASKGLAGPRRDH